MKVTFFGTTTLLFDDGKDQILFDCHFTRPSLKNYVLGKDLSNRSVAGKLPAMLHDIAVSTDRKMVNEML